RRWCGRCWRGAEALDQCVTAYHAGAVVERLLSDRRCQRGARRGAHAGRRVGGGERGRALEAPCRRESRPGGARRRRVTAALVSLGGRRGRAGPLRTHDRAVRVHGGRWRVSGMGRIVRGDRAPRRVERGGRVWEWWVGGGR